MTHVSPPAAAAHFRDYSSRLAKVFETHDWRPVQQLADELLDCLHTGRQVFFAGNGGSAGNAIHLVNDFIYAMSKRRGVGLRAHALPANQATITCLANDEGYDEIFSGQLAVQAQRNDVLIVFSGSGNSPNILRALEEARRIGMRSYAVLGYSGGKAKALTDVAIHFQVDDMQIAEDAQLITGHMIMQWMAKQVREQAPASAAAARG
ncbi:MAG: SIS domain-containing protein [Rhizobiales bacterium]|nr:SIS domain-containing protein [Hyphomicrobiales bacterium]